MAKRRKPHDPSAAIRADNERKEREAERARLEAQGAKVTTDRAGRILSAKRSNPFNLLLMRKTITLDHHMAGEWFCEHWAAWKGLDGGPEKSGEIVDGASGEASLVTDRMIRAGRMVKWILGELSPISRKLLEAFAVSTVEEDRPMQWRGVMERHGVFQGDITVRGEREERQAWAFVQMCEELRVLYQEPRERAA